MRSPIIYRKGKLEDLSEMHFARGLSATTNSIEFNVLGTGHEFWMAVQGKAIVGLTVLGRTSPNEFKIMYLQVAPSRKSHGIGSALLRAVTECYADCEFSVIPFEGTEDFYRRLGFEKVNQWEMRKRR
jgi:ribosomal protein S18 acetylase RimI-like enzyme